jgi:hypothetical protein
MAFSVPSIAIELGTPHAHGHHSPGQVLHALRIRELRSRLGVEPPYLRCERVVLLHFLWALHTGRARIILEAGEDGVLEHALASSRVLG